MKSVLIEIDLDSFKINYVFPKEFAEYITKSREYSIRIIRELTEEESKKALECEAYLYAEAIEFLGDEEEG